MLPRFSARSGIRVNVVAVGTGRALDIGRRGDADVVFVHDRPAEENSLTEGFGVKRFDVMYNDFVIVGPKASRPHPRQRRGRRIGRSPPSMRRSSRAATFPYSRGGVRTGRMPESTSAAKGPWYRDIGQGMGPALNMAASADAYVLADRGTGSRSRTAARSSSGGRDRRLFTSMA
jgi:tungstate transport system substrate-binding protein